LLNRPAGLVFFTTSGQIFAISDVCRLEVRTQNGVTGEQRFALHEFSGDSRRQIILVRNAWGHTAAGYLGGAALVSTAPFSDADLDGHPTFALSVALLTLLLSRGWGR